MFEQVKLVGDAKEAKLTVSVEGSSAYAIVSGLRKPSRAKLYEEVDQEELRRRSEDWLRRVKEFRRGKKAQAGQD